MKFLLMNKDHPIALFQKSAGNFEILETIGKLPFGFRTMSNWIANRKSSKHNQYLKTLMSHLGLDNDETYLQLTHATTINDTFWVKAVDEPVVWNEISLYQNEFSEIVSKMAYEGF